MKIDEKIIKHFEKLLKVGENITKKLHIARKKDVDWTGKVTHTPTHKFVDYQQSARWGTSCLYLLENVYTKKGDHYLGFKSNSLRFASDRNFRSVVTALGILKAAKYDYENASLFNTRTLIEAEVFDDFLEQAEYLLSQGYSVAAAVIAGSVLEDSLRKICVKNGIILSAKPKLDAMNIELGKANVYNLLKQKQITALADLRNKAAHGLGGFTKDDVEAMIKDVRRFTADYFS